MKRVRALMAAVLLVLALCVTAFAAPPVGSGGSSGTVTVQSGPQGPDPIIPPIE